MSQTLILDGAGTLTRWSVDGHDLLHPLTTTSANEPRGGAPVCVPIFSRVPPAMRREGLDMPIHGLMAEMDFIDESPAKLPSRVTLHHRADACFEWDFECTVSAETTANGFMHSVAVTRPGRGVPSGMPLSIGWHPYFATHGRDFRIEIDGWELGKANIREGRSIIFFSDTERAGPVHIDLGHGRITLSFPDIVRSYDRVCIWTDDPDRYICVEPIFGYLRFGHPNWLLALGEARKVVCQIGFAP